VKSGQNVMPLCQEVWSLSFFSRCEWMFRSRLLFGHLFSQILLGVDIDHIAERPEVDYQCGQVGRFIGRIENSWCTEKSKFLSL